ncbi:2-keto-4-pentenoate hydratase [Pseudonocardia hydrocarbonoxydans]|uniref:Hydratase n=1 Tax=Pseudonocardia hydrocarbonoxydans TaxID=76726 RepID=A0A4Y3WRM0_9PSEU|nr:fumarylacetoacetate hydrolase family protein [Pseudonocardia hydrocarbonoxydans]GEC21148.1 hydratase [Pseudonocardia hydrocarbonoxydans]
MADAARCAELLWAAWRRGERMTALPEPPADEAAGMAVQNALRPLVGESYGWKIAATSAAGQAHVRVSGPLPGPLFTRFRFAPGDVLPSHDLHMRVAEAEFAFRLGADVHPGDDVLAAVDALHLAVELPDSRFVDFAAVGPAQLLADAACASRFVLGPEVPDWRGLDLSTAGTALWINGAEAARGTGAAVLGDPRTALAWLAAELPRFGHRLRAGDVVTTGTTTPPPTVGPGDAVRADFGELGSVGFTLRA